MSTYKKLTLMVPTYKRIEWIERFLSSAERMADQIDNIEFVVCYNKKDLKTKEYLQTREWVAAHKLIEETTVQPNLSKYFNLMYDQTDCEVVSMLGDDMIFETKGYDTALLNEINKYNGNGIFWCNDKYIAREKLCVNLFVTRDFVKCTGKDFMAPMFKADMIDAVWFEVGRLTHNLHYLKDVIIHHKHSTGIDAPFDYTFQRLVPLQKNANSSFNQAVGKIYATIIAGNLIASGHGSW